jgi:manganese oxidase
MKRAMTATFLALLCAIVASLAPALGATRTYYIAADEVVWDYAPTGRDLIAGTSLPPFPKLTLGLAYRKILYREYTDKSFKTRTVQPASLAYMGLLGPTIHAEVGDTIVVVFKNNAHIPTNISPGAAFGQHPPPVPPAAIRRYVWDVPEGAGPGAMDGSSIAWRYFSTVDEMDDESTGMIGAIVVTKRGAAKPDGSPADVDREVLSLFSEMDETRSRMIGVNLADPTINPKHVKPLPPGFGYISANQFFTIDGYVFGNMPMPVLRKGERDRWYVITTGGDFDAHVPHWHGQTVTLHGMRTDAIDIEDNQVKVVDMLPDNPGIWLLHCHVAGHLQGGMEARFEVLP